MLVLCGALATSACGGGRESAPTSAPPEPAPYGPTVDPKQARLLDAREVARVQGISVDEALHRLDLQSDAIPAFSQQVRKRERDRYGGLYIQHEPEYRIVVLLTSGALSDVEGYVPELLRDLVVVRQVERTAAQLRWMHERVGRLRSVVPFGSWTNVQLNRVEVEFIAPTSSEVESTIRRLHEAAAQSGEPLPDWVAITGKVVPVDATPGEWPDFLLRRSPVGGLFEMDALPSGTLELDLDRGCVLLSGRAVVWPAGTTLTRDPPQLHLPGGLTAKSGDTVRGGGGALPGAHLRENSNVIEGDLDSALACAPEHEVFFFTSRGAGMSVSRGG